MAQGVRSFGNFWRVSIIAGLLAGCEDSDRIGDWRVAKIREACFSDTATAHDSHQGKGLPRGGREIKYPEILRGMTMQAALNCYVAKNAQAVCEKNNRAYIVDYIGRYFRLKDKMYAAAERVGDAERRIADNLWSDPRDQAILTALENHIANGRLNRSDFGWSKPAQLAALLDENRDVADACLQEAAWQPPEMPFRQKTFNEVRSSQGAAPR